MDSSNTNGRGIPAAEFYEFKELSLEEAEKQLTRFQEFIAKYRFMETSIVRRVAGLDEKLPEIEKTLQTVTFLEAEQDENLDVLYELDDTLYANAQVTASNTVCLWLGANVMLEYPVAEAKTLLTSKLEAAKETLKTCKEDLEFLRAQITTMEVNTARVYNHTVELKRRQK
ncbi:prefoldin subunit 3 [Schizosaccharomyces japonicus yFS275]|uniref:Prefoldin subunit 3 n=1 Tax=Schizosaccharomyces japonicus (strain yFS275 / FY16936) TaxID=402676 RepID=B6JVT9_SCHJY|nr:prefoldin subunit 3 [Schizosaccharomyces japonicus yFS275]EEB05490.2 prefoldin subunit 3 [Schizosaccharomyces japonicus yFS275]